MKTTQVFQFLAVLLVSGLLLGAEGGGAEATDVAKNPSLLLASAKAGDLEVYGVKLGDTIDKITASAGTNRHATDRPEDVHFTGPNVTYYSHQGRIYQIKVFGDITKALPPYGVARLQIKLGKADEVYQPEAGVTCLIYLKSRMQFTFAGTGSVAAVDLYEP
ncbi:MAG: hypothetical protein WCI73_07835 [Phycisphaerae bacterium]